MGYSFRLTARVLLYAPQREREMFYLTTHSTHFIYGHMASDIWLRTILIVRKETRCRHIGYSYRLTARVLLYAPSHRQDSTYHGLCYTSRGTLSGTRNSSMGPPHEGSIRRPIAPWANALPLSYVPLPLYEPSHRQDSTYHGLCYTSCGALAGTRNSSMSTPHEGPIRRPITPWANTLTTELHLAPTCQQWKGCTSTKIHLFLPTWRTVSFWAVLCLHCTYI